MLYPGSRAKHGSTLPELVATDLGVDGELRMVFKIPVELARTSRRK